MQLMTERLELIVLNARQFRLWLEDIGALEAELCCRYDGEPMDYTWTETVDGQTVTECYRDVLHGQLGAVEADPQNDVWRSFWWILRKSDRTVVGSADFKAPPGENGEVEIGYGLRGAYAHNGYMTETVSAMCAWALRQPGVRAVTALTETDNLPSQRVLERCGFLRCQEGDEILWRLTRTPQPACDGESRREEQRNAVTLRPIDVSNYLDAFRLELEEAQRQYVSDPIRSLAQAYVWRAQCTPFGIYAGDRMVGYVLVLYDYDEETYNIWHLMIDRAAQHRGFGRAAMRAVLDYIRTRPFGTSDTVLLTCAPENRAAYRLYESLGFTPTGRSDGEETELSLRV